MCFVALNTARFSFFFPAAFSYQFCSDHLCVPSLTFYRVGGVLRTDSFPTILYCLAQNTGTIFGIFEQSECDIEEGIDFSDGIDADEEKCLADTLQPGNNLVAAGYCLYSSATSFVFTIGSGVYGFTLDERIGEFVLTHPDMKIPNRGKIYSFNEANRWDWDRPMQQYVTDIQQGLVRTVINQ